MTTAILIPSKFDLGTVVATSSLIHAMEEAGHDETAVVEILARHASGDWGDLDAEDKRENENALKNGERILSRYTVGEINCYIITEWDRSVTTIMRVEDY